MLYQHLDIKEDNNYSKSDQSKVPTDPIWLNFINNANKVVLPPLEKKECSLDRYINKYEPILAKFLLFLYIINNKDRETFEHNIYEILVNNLSLDNKSYHRLNLYLDKLSRSPITDDDVYKIKGEFHERMIDLELPF